MASATSSNDDSQYRIIVNSVGNAKPATTAAIAKGLGLSTAVVVSRLYRAPAVLVEGVEENVARKMVALLCGIGYQAEFQDISQPAPPRMPLYDVAVYVEEVDRFLPTVTAISEFIGISEADATNMLLSPPGIVLGSVSEATVKAFSSRLGDGVSIISSVPAEARYTLFLDSTAEIVRQRILDEMREAGITLVAERGLVAVDVDHGTAHTLWSRHQATGMMRVVNTDFLRFDLVCTGIASGFEQCSQDQVKLLESLVGIPPDFTPEVLHSLPLTLLEAVPNGKVEHYMTELANVGLVMRAELISFQFLRLRILTAADPVATLNVLSGYGVFAEQVLPRPPFTLKSMLPELQAKLVKAALENSGAEVEFVEDNQ